MLDQQQPIEDALAGLQQSLIASLNSAGRFATGKTAAAIQIETISPEHTRLVAPDFFYALETGRKPTGAGAAKGDPTLFQSIQEWCSAKGIDPKAAWPITESIHKNGYPGTPGVISEPLSEDNIEKYFKPALGDLAGLFAMKVLETLNIPQTA